MTDGAALLSETNSPLLDVFCSRCGRRGRYRIETLIDRFGADARLPDVASTLEEGCPQKGDPAGCLVTFPGLVHGQI